MKNIQFFISWLLCAALIFSNVPVAAAANTATEQLLSKARSLEGRGRIDLAARVWQQTLLADPNNSEALLGLAKFAKQNGKIEEANQYLAKLRSLDPKNPSIATVEDVKSAGKQRSGTEEASQLAAKQDFVGAMRIYRNLFGSEPPPGPVAIGYYETEAATPGGWNDAVAGMAELAAKYPQAAEYRLSLGRLKTYREPTRIEGMEVLAELKGDTQLENKARAAWRQALVWSAGSAASLPSLQAYLSRYPDSELQKLIAKSPNETESVAQTQSATFGNTESNLGYAALNAERVAEAEKHFQAALKATPHNPVPLAGLGYVRMKQENFTSAIELFKQSLSVQPKNKSVVDALATSRFDEEMKLGSNALSENKAQIAAGHFEKALGMVPASEDASVSLAGAYMSAQQPALALPLYEKLTHQKPQELNYWYGLVKARYQSSGPDEALADLKRAPVQVKDEWAKNPEHLAMLSFIYADAGAMDESTQFYDRAVAAAAASQTELPVYQQLQFAGLSLRMNHTKQATDTFLKIATKHPSNVDAWSGAISALLQIPDAARAYDALQRMPQTVYANALKKPDFLRTLARLQISRKRYDLAERSLDESARIDAAQGKLPDVDGQLQMATIDVQLQRPAEAEKLLRSIIESYPDDKRAWVALVSTLHESKADVAALAEIERMPERVSAETQNDPGFVGLAASVYANEGYKDRAIALVRSCRKHYETRRHVVPVELDIQLSWLLMNSQDGQLEVSKLLERDNARPDVTAAERNNLNQVFSVLSLKRAEAAIEEKDFTKALSILNGALSSLPHDARIQGMIASTFMRHGDYEKAFDEYQSWDLKGAEAEDFRGAVGAASAAHQEKVAAKWLDRGLAEFPDNPKLLELAGEQAAQHRDYIAADSYFRKALEKIATAKASLDESAPAKAELTPAKPAVKQENRIKQGVLGSALVGTKPADNDGARVIRVSMRGQSVLDARADDKPVPTDQTPGPFLFDRQFADGNDAPVETATHDLAETVEITSPNDAQASGLLELKSQIQGELEELSARNTPYLQNGVSLQQRTGEGGFDKLLIEEVNLQASTTVADRVRLTLMATPTYVDSGSPALPTDDGHLGFGTVAVDGTPGTRSAFGVAGGIQVATGDFGLRAGLTPEEFLVHGWTGGLRWNPGGGHITFLLDRDPIRDTMLSFAGERDPASRQVWGGVMANTASVAGNWSSGNTGYYAKADYQDIEGKLVEKNARIEANVGSYFKVYHSQQGDLTVGVNLSGMHYDNNLRYFTLGQGGYFSPQQYFLFNVPLQWTGTVSRQLQYSLSASLGVQHFTENSSPFFPADAARQALSGQYYPTYTNTGGNYNLSFRSIYQITPQWIGGAFFDVDNSREYRAVSAGFYLKYLLKPRPSLAGLNLTPVPDWTGASPFSLR